MLNKQIIFSKLNLLFIVVIAGIIFLFTGIISQPAGEGNNKPYVVAANQIEAGRYIAIISGCNDCHTDGYLMAEGKIPEEDWLTGSSLGWRGPWGTTYPVNLRLRVQEITEEEWVMMLHERKELPPMPWMNINKMSETDAKALYQYIKSLGPKGEHAPKAIGPDEEPKTPYISIIPLNLPQK